MSISCWFTGWFGNLSITDNVGNANAITVKLVSPNIVLTDANQVFDTAPGGGSLSNGGKTLTIPLSSVTGKLTINASAGADTLTVDYSVAIRFRQEESYSMVEIPRRGLVTSWN